MKKLFFIFLIISAVISCKSPEARYPVSQNSGSYINESVAYNKKLLAEEESKIKKIIAQDSTKNYIASTSGFWYFYNEKVMDSVSSIRPEFGDVVNFDYYISTLDNQMIYEKGEKPTKEYAVDQEKLFSGLRDGIKLMKAGETVTFLFPSYKAFGYYGDKNKIGTNIPIKTTVTLHSIIDQDSIN
ncbi:gliding motility-associated peptidyl-prolyl isomerase GldI [Zunongwangia sp. HRR-M8]|uniref:gliding motility-associated peptidyl-prolyl isomerase GldI n=1 Tax=Zunongwangia sp. HRR-M8 TaxID=3015170 RepID=UPI0022DDCA75|nr:gliding motility-associated peptidyl-prolyl isomerase GldI [Zunongwangia sp. HRR-M8]WBL23499.1 gliding motility-associated peptidyl-prolyl isomerase GldI [Zunongwangia sp. HRR-M8]